ncbi:MAG: TonB-dependent receptor [Rhodocyclaceae bacterium]|nr:TonB-dependent receptor [Rhodocyclaceae bacterium]
MTNMATATTVPPIVKPAGANDIWRGKLPSYHTFDLTGAYDVSKQLKLTAAIKNLTDKRYIAGMRQGIYAGPERSFEIGAKYTF